MLLFNSTQKQQTDLCLWTDSNCQPFAYQANALTIELHKRVRKLVVPSHFWFYPSLSLANWPLTFRANFQMGGQARYRTEFSCATNMHFTLKLQNPFMWQWKDQNPQPYYETGFQDWSGQPLRFTLPWMPLGDSNPNYLNQNQVC